MAEPTVKLTLRLPPELHDALVKRAAKNEISLNEVTVRALRYAMIATDAAFKKTTKVETTVEVLTL